MFVRRFVGCVLVAVLYPLSVRGQELPSPLTVHALVEAVRQRNPQLAEQEHLARSAAARPSAAGLLDDPTVSVEWWQQPVNFQSVPIMISARQSLPWPGKLAARRHVAERQATTARDQVLDLTVRLEVEAVRVFLDLALAADQLVVNERMSALLTAMVATTEAKYRVGRAAQAEVLKAQSELLTLESERLDLVRARDEARVRLNALLDRSTDAVVPPTRLETNTVTLPSLETAIERAVTRRPAIRLAQAAVAEAEARVALVRLENRPELGVWAGYMINVRGTDTFTLGVSTSLPIFSSRRRSALMSAEESEVRARRAALQGARRRAEQEVRVAFLGVEAFHRRERLLAEKLIPLAELALQSAEAAYQSDRISFLAVLDAARMLRDRHLDHAQYRIEYQRRLVDLELALGGPLEGGR